MTLSPAAQAVITALNTAPAHTRLMAAAALRAAVVAAGIDSYNPPRRPNHQETEWFVDGKCVRNADILAELLAITTELENAT